MFIKPLQLHYLYLSENCFTDFLNKLTMQVEEVRFILFQRKDLFHQHFIYSVQPFFIKSHLEGFDSRKRFFTCFFEIFREFRLIEMNK